MNRLILAATVPLGLLAAACQSETGTVTEDENTVPTSETLGTGTLAMADGTEVGSVQLIATGNSLAIEGEFSGLPEGEHAFHLHTTGACDAPDFSSAGGHLNPDEKEHGVLNPAGAHMGDLPNVIISDDGAGGTVATLPGKRDEIVSAIFDDDGTAVMIHEGADDYTSDPAGDAGSRIACGVLTQT